MHLSDDIPDTSPGLAGWVGSFAGNRVLFTKRTTAGKQILLARNIDGSDAAARLDDDASTPQGFDLYGVTPDDHRVIYQGATNITRRTLYTRPVDGTGTPQPVLGNLDTDNWAPRWRFRPGSDEMVVRTAPRSGTPSVGGTLQLLPSDGSAAPRQVSHASTSGEVGGSWEITRDGNAVLYQYNNSLQVSIYASDLRPPLASPVQLYTSAVPTSSSLFQLESTPDGSRAVWFVQPNVGNGGVFSRPIDGSTPATPLSSAFRAGPLGTWFQVAPDGSRVAFAHNANGASYNKLYTVPADGSAPEVKLTDHEVRYYEFTPDSSRVVYLADTDGNLSSGRINKVYSQPAAGGAALELFSNPALDSIQKFTLTPAGDRAVFMPNWNQLWQAPVNGAQPAGMMKDFGSDDVLEYKYSPDGKYLIAAIGVDLDSSAETLWAIPLDGAQQPFLLNHTLSGNGDIYHFDVSPDSAWVAYNAADATTAGSELYAVPLPEPGAVLLTACGSVGLTLRRRRCQR